MDCIKVYKQNTIYNPEIIDVTFNYKEDFVKAKQKFVLCYLTTFDKYNVLPEDILISISQYIDKYIISTSLIRNKIENTDINGNYGVFIHKNYLVQEMIFILNQPTRYNSNPNSYQINLIDTLTQFHEKDNHEITELIGKTCPMFYKDSVLVMINELNRINKVTWYTLKICIMENMICLWD